MKSALLIIDVQNALCVGKYACDDIELVVERINEIADKARSVGAPVFFIQHEETEGPLQFQTDGWQLFDMLVVHPGDHQIRKTACDSFHRTELHSQLQSYGVGQVIVCGLQSEFCVDSTVRGALAKSYPVILVSNAHSTLANGILSAAQISEHHNVTLTNIGSFGPSVKAMPAIHVRIEA